MGGGGAIGGDWGVSDPGKNTRVETAKGEKAQGGKKPGGNTAGNWPEGSWGEGGGGIAKTQDVPFWQTNKAYHTTYMLQIGPQLLLAQKMAQKMHLILDVQGPTFVSFF